MKYQSRPLVKVVSPRPEGWMWIAKEDFDPSIHTIYEGVLNGTAPSTIPELTVTTPTVTTTDSQAEREVNRVRTTEPKTLPQQPASDLSSGSAPANTVAEQEARTLQERLQALYEIPQGWRRIEAIASAMEIDKPSDGWRAAIQIIASDPDRSLHLVEAQEREVAGG